MTTLLVMTALWWAILFAACAGLRRFLGARWKRIAALAVIPAALIAAGLELFTPPLGAYDPLVARYWMSRAAVEPDAAAKESHVRRVALTGPDHGVAEVVVAAAERPLCPRREGTRLAVAGGVQADRAG